jgi:hypothetical protein
MRPAAKHFRRMSLVTIAAVAFPLFALANCRHDEASLQWRQAQEARIVTAILVDLAEMPPDQHDPTDLRTAFCVSVEGSSGDPVDPPAAVIAELRAKGLDVHPVSHCGRWTVTATGEKATDLAVSSIEWKSNDLVKAEAARLLGPLAGNSWRYTLSKTHGGWKVDTVKVDLVF